MGTAMEFPSTFITKVEHLDSGCWKWLACTDKRTGHGYYWYLGRTQVASTFAWEWVNGRAPAGSEVDHFRFPDGGCIGAACVNPAHLRAVSHRENSLRGNGVGARNLAKTRCPKGHPYDRVDRRGRVCGECERIRSRARSRARSEA